MGNCIDFANALLKNEKINKGKTKVISSLMSPQGQSTRSQRWFDLDFDWIEVHFSTREPNFYKKLFQSHNDTLDINTFKKIQAPIGNAKCVESFKFQNDAPILKYF